MYHAEMFLQLVAESHCD